MKKSARFSRVLAVVMAVAFALSFTACQTASPTATPVATQAQTQAAQSSAPAPTETTPPTAKPITPITLTLLVKETGTKWNNYPDNPVAQDIKAKTGVTIQYVESDNDKFQVLVAGGDLPDIIRADAVNDGKQLVDGNVIIPLDDLLQTNGPNILKDIPTTIDYSRKLWSFGTGKVYFLPPQIRTSESNLAYDNTVGTQIRWDYYKEIGAPVIKTPDDLLNVLVQIQKNHPTTANGKKVYGVSSWSDWGPYVYVQPMFDFTGNAPSGYSEALLDPPYQVTPYPKALYTDPNSNYWMMVEFEYKAKKLGLLDPDSLTQKNDDFMAKCTAGQVIYTWATWIEGNFNAENAKNGMGYMDIPVEGGYSYAVSPVYPNPIGWKDKAYAISKNCKTPDRAMDFFNYIFSYEGARTMYSGIEGVNWEMKDGIPVLKQETIDLLAQGGENWAKTGITLDGNLLGFTGNSVNPTDNRPVDLFETPENYIARLNPLEKDFCSYYKVDYPGALYTKMIDEKRLNNNPPMDVADFTQARVKVMTPTTDDIKKIEAKLYDMAMTTAAKAILAKSDDEFAAIKTQAMKDFTDAGAPAVLDWYTQAVKDARAAVGLK